MGVKFAFELVDRATGPANRIANALERSSKALANADKGSKLGQLRSTVDKAGFAVRVAFGDKAAGLLDKFAHGQLKVGEKAEIVRKGLDLAKGGAGAAGNALVGLGSVALAGATALATLGAAALGFAAAGALSAVEMAKFKETQQAALTFALGSGQAAEASTAQVQKIADTIGINIRDASQQFRELSKYSFQEGESQLVLQLAEDLKASNGGNAVALATLAGPIEALKRNEQLTSASFAGLEAAGMSKDRLYQVLAKKLGVTVKNGADSNKTKRDVEKALMGAKLRGQKAVDFFTSVNLDALGEDALGKKAKEFKDTTLTGSIEKLSNRWENFKASLGDTGAGQAAIRILQKFATVLEPGNESGEKLRATIGRIGKAAGDFLDKIDLDQLIGDFDDLVDAVDSAIVPLREFGGGALQGFKEARATVSELAEAFGISAGQGEGFSGALRSVGTALGYVVVGVGLVIGAGIALEAKLAALAISVGKAGVKVGAAIVAGIVQGLASVKGVLSGAMDSIVEVITGTPTKDLKIHSPSRVMHQIGVFTGEGLVGGLQASEGNVSAAARGALSAPVVAAAQLPAGAVRGGGGGSFSITIQVNGNDRPESVAQSVREELVRFLEQMGLESGLVPQ